MSFQFENTQDNRVRWRIPYWFACELARASFASSEAFAEFWADVSREVYAYDETAWHGKNSEGSKMRRAAFANELFARHEVESAAASTGIVVGI